MALTTCAVSGTIQLPDGTLPSGGGTITFTLNRSDTDTYDGTAVSAPVSATLAADGTFTANVWPNERGPLNTFYKITVDLTSATQTTSYSLGNLRVPDVSSITMEKLTGVDPLDFPRMLYLVREDTGLAQRWANHPEDSVVANAEYSAKHYALKAAVNVYNPAAVAITGGTIAGITSFAVAGNADVTGIFSITSVAPQATLNETDAAADYRLWDIIASGQELIIRARTDAGAAGGGLWKFTRSGNNTQTMVGQYGGADKITLNNQTSKITAGIFQIRTSITNSSIYTDSTTSLLVLAGGNNINVGINLNLYSAAHATKANDLTIRAGTQNVYLWDDSAGTHTWYDNAGASDLILAGNTAFKPATDNQLTFGTASLRVKEFFGAIGTINTSDKREKTNVDRLTGAEIEAGIALADEIGTFQFLKSIEGKGDDARRHVGMTVQRAIEIMKAEGLDPFRYGFVCYDKWDAVPDVPESVEFDEDGNELVVPGQAGIPAGDRYSFRPDQLNAFICAGLSARVKRLEAAKRN